MGVSGHVSVRGTDPCHTNQTAPVDAASTRPSRHRPERTATRTPSSPVEVMPMSERNPEHQVQWMEDPPDSWDQAPRSPPEPDATQSLEGTTHSGGLILHERDTSSAYLYVTEPVEPEL